MAKSPKIRHSKTSTEPVTIDLSAEEVSHLQPESESDGAAERPAAPQTAAAEAAKPASSKPAEPARTEAAASASAARSGSVPPVTPSSSSDPRPAEAPKTDTPPQREAASKADTAPKSDSPGVKGPSAFGRDAGSRAAPPPPPPPRPEASPRRGAGSMIAAGLVGGVIALGGAAGAYYGGFLPAQQAPAAPDTQMTDALRAEIDSLREELAELRNAPPTGGGDTAGLADANARIESVSVLVEEMRAQLAQLAESVPAGNGSDTAALDELRASLSALQERVAALPAQGAGAETEALRTDIARIEENVRSAVESASSAAAAANTAGQRIDGLERSLTELTARVEEQEQTPGVALAIAASALKAAIDRGTPFMTELETYAGLAPQAPEVAALRDMAASGVPTRAAIAAETDAAAVRMIEAGRVVDPDAGFLDRLWSSAQSLVTVRPIGEVEGEGVPAVVARMEAALDAGDFERAIAEYETLPQEAKTAGAAFMDKVRARHTADRLVDQALSAALRA